MATPEQNVRTGTKIIKALLIINSPSIFRSRVLAHVVGFSSSRIQADLESQT
jgi:hypothetical protein